MSLDVAKKLYEELMADETKKAEYLKNPAAFLTAGGYDCTPDEIKEVMTMDRKLDDNEMWAVNGGTSCFFPGAAGNGHCWTNYFREVCAATVEEGSWCLTNDWCHADQMTYGKIIRNRPYKKGEKWEEIQPTKGS